MVPQILKAQLKYVLTITYFILDVYVIEQIVPHAVIQLRYPKQDEYICGVFRLDKKNLMILLVVINNIRKKYNHFIFMRNMYDLYTKILY